MTVNVAVTDTLRPRGRLSAAAPISTILLVLDTDSNRSRPSDRSATACLILCESSGRWGGSLRRVLRGRVPLRAAAGLAGLGAWLGHFPASFAIVEVTAANAEALFDRLLAAEREYPHAAVAAAGCEELAVLEGAFREAGAVGWIDSPRRIDPWVEAAVGHVVRAPRREREWQERVWEGLPWA